MLIKALCDYYDVQSKSGKENKDNSDLLGTQEVSYMIMLTPEGEISGIIDIRKAVTDAKGKTKYKPMEIVLPRRSQKPGIDLNIIEHRALYIFGLNWDKKSGAYTTEDKTQKAKKSHQVFKDGNLEFCEGLDSDIVSAYRNFLLRWEPEEQTENRHLLRISGDYDKSYYCFALDGNINKKLHEDFRILNKYREFRKTKSEEAEEGKYSICPIEGESLPVARIHDKIKGIRGGNPIGGILVGVKNSAFESYGKTQAYNSGISENAMKKYTVSLNKLLSDRTHCTYLDELTVIYFAIDQNDGAECDLFASMLNGGEENRLNINLDSIIKQFRDGTSRDLDSLNVKTDLIFYVAGLTPNSSRISQKFILRDNFGKVIRNLLQHQLDFQISDNMQQIQLWKITSELKSKKSSDDKVPPPLVSSLFSSILNGTNYPVAMLEAVIRRIRIDSDEEKNKFIKINDTRIRIIKAYLNRKSRIFKNKEEIKMGLDSTNTNQAYLCGRLFAVLEHIQQAAANGALNRTIKDAYFSSACVRPSTVFPKLIMLAQNHLAKIEGGYKVYLSKLIGEITSLINGDFPQTLPLDEQGKFIIGYYHQNKALYTKKTDNKKIEEE